MTDEEGLGKEGEGPKPKVRVIAPIEGLETKTQVASYRVENVISRMCAYHLGLPAMYICAQCQSSLCQNCAIPYGQLFICNQCYNPPPQPAPAETKEPEKPPLESIVGFFGGLLVLIGFFLPWAGSGYISPRTEEGYEPFASGFNIASDYQEVILILTMGILIMMVEFILIFLTTSPTMIKRPPLGIRLVPTFLAFIGFIVLIEVLIRAEGLLDNIQGGWFMCAAGCSLGLWRGVMDARKHYSKDGG